MLLLHGYGDSWRSFERVLPRLPVWIRAIAFTQRGHGDASKPATGHRVEDMARDASALLDDLAIARAVLVASSSATFTAQRIAAREPERVAGLVLVGAPWSVRELAVARELLDALSGIGDPVDPDFVARFVRETASPEVPEEFLEAMTRESAKLPARAWRETLQGLIDEEPAAATTRIGVPALIIWGDADRVVTRADQQRLLAALPRSRLVVYEGVGHVVHWEQPARVAEDVATFVAGLDI